MFHKDMLIDWMFLKGFTCRIPLNNYSKHYIGLAKTMFTNVIIT